MNKLLEDALDGYFLRFESTRELASEFIAKRKYPVETLILLCARLDALASDAADDETSSKRAFTSFVGAYGGKRDLLNSVSIGDLYYELAYHRWLLEGTIPAPGRVHRFSKLDEPIIHLLEDAGLPLTLTDSRILFDTIIRICKREYRVAPGQRLTKQRLAKPLVFQDIIVKAAMQTRLKKIAENLPKALAPLLETKRVGTILYRQFRSESIHGATILLDSQRFFSETEVYWKPLRSDFYGAFERIEFPAHFLLSLLEHCLATYRTALIAKGKVPPSVHFCAFPNNIFESLDLLDNELLPEGGQVRFKIDR